MSRDALKLTVYCGERDRHDGGFVADALTAIYARHELRTSVLLRAVEGFGAGSALRSDRLLTLSEDLPLVSVAVDARPRIEAALQDVRRLRFHGLVTLERAQLVTGRIEPVAAAGGPHEQTKLTVYLGRGERAAGRPAHEAVVDVLRRRGVAGATVLLGIDGTAHGVRRRARLLGGNVEVPLMVIAVGDADAIAGALAELGTLLARPLATLERVRVVKRDGRRLADPHHLPPADAEGLGVWHKLMVYAGRPLHEELLGALRGAGAAGATTVRGIWGYHGDHAPHGDAWWPVRRRVPLVTVVVDTPARTGEWLAIVDELTAAGGLVTSEMVPAYRATTPGAERGGLRLARL